jgi:uncharacterized protein YoxC
MELVKTPNGIAASAAIVLTGYTIFYVRSNFKELREECKKMEETIKGTIDQVQEQNQRIEGLNKIKNLISKQERTIDRIFSSVEDMKDDLNSHKHILSHLQEFLVSQGEYKKPELPRSKDRRSNSPVHRTHHHRSRSVDRKRTERTGRTERRSRSRSVDTHRNRSRDDRRRSHRDSTRSRSVDPHRNRSRSRDDRRPKASTHSTSEDEERQVDAFLRKIRH